MTEFPTFADALREADESVGESKSIISMVCLVGLMIAFSWVWIPLCIVGEIQSRVR